MEFFIPEASAEKVEQIYEEFADIAGRKPLPLGERIQSITWKKTAVETWTAEVGKPLSGKKAVERGRGTSRREYSESLSDGATVLAIFPGYPYMVVTNKGYVPGVRSLWENPLLASPNPTHVQLFELPKTVADSEGNTDVDPEGRGPRESEDGTEAVTDS